MEIKASKSNRLAYLYISLLLVNLFTSTTGFFTEIQIITGIAILLIILPHLLVIFVIPELVESNNGTPVRSDSKGRIWIISVTIPVIALSSIGMVMGILEIVSLLVFNIFVNSLLILGTIIKLEDIEIPPQIMNEWKRIKPIWKKDKRNWELGNFDLSILIVTAVLILATFTNGFNDGEERTILYFVGEDGGFEGLKSNYSSEETIVIISRIIQGDELDLEQMEIRGILYSFEDENRTVHISTDNLGIHKLVNSGDEIENAFSIGPVAAGYYTFSAEVYEPGFDIDVFRNVTHKFMVSE